MHKFTLVISDQIAPSLGVDNIGTVEPCTPGHFPCLGLPVHSSHIPLGDHTAVPFRRAGIVLYAHPFSSLVRTMKQIQKKKKNWIDYKITRAFLVRTPLSTNNRTWKSGPMSRSFRPFWDFKFVGLFYQEGFKL